MKPLQNLSTHLAARVATLEKQLAVAQAAAARSLEAAREASITPNVQVTLDESGALLIHLPGSHTLRWELGTTKESHGNTMLALIQVLRDRAPAARHMIAQPGAPTIAELRKAVARFDGPVVKCEAATRAADRIITLADLGL